MGITNPFGRQRRCHIIHLLLRLTVVLLLLLLLPLLLPLLLIKSISIEYRAN
jgi:hypothetical protein